MAMDLHIHWKTPSQEPGAAMPTAAVMHDFLRDAVGGLVEWKGVRFVVSLPAEVLARATRLRWIEVVEGDDYWSVITRDQDGITGVAGRILAVAIARAFHGELRP